jgi:glyceraldehyde 3-phosphate dehydrogenase
VAVDDPTSTATAIGQVIPDLAHRRRRPGPVENGSLTDLTVEISPANITAEQINRAFAEAAGGRLKSILYTEDRLCPATSSSARPHACSTRP